VSERRAGVPREIQRFTANELAQHWVLLLALTVLALTGLGLFAAETWLGRTLILLEGGIEARGTLHRASAIALMLLVGWHFLYVVFTERGHRQLMAMMLEMKDFRDIGALLGFLVGRRGAMPELGRFSPLQKLQYWGAGIGSLTMVFTGLILWFHTAAMMVMPKWVFDLTTVVHGYEGLILFALLFGWHLYIVHLSPGNFPMQRTFLDGRITTQRLWNEHRAEYRQEFGDQKPPADPGAPRKGGRR